METEIKNHNVKWQVIIAGSRTYGAKKNVFVECKKDFKDFVKAVYDTLSSKVIIKICMVHPSKKEKQLEQVCPHFLFIYFFIFGSQHIWSICLRSVKWKKISL